MWAGVINQLPILTGGEVFQAHRKSEYLFFTYTSVKEDFLYKSFREVNNAQSECGSTKGVQLTVHLREVEEYY